MQGPTAGGVVAAAALLGRRVNRTPVLESLLLNKELGGGRLLVKAECLQVTGSFKYRGALHRLLRLRADDPRASARGVVAFSSGNFGQALAAAATSLGVKCTIVSPHDAPPLKLERIAAYGATLVTSTPRSAGENREVAAAALARGLSEEQGLTLLHPFDCPHVVHGQGTLGLEFIEQADEILNRNGPGSIPEENFGVGLTTMDTIVVPVGGGGMAAGVCLAVEAAGLGRGGDGGGGDGGGRARCRAATRVVTVEPTGYDDHAHSLGLGRRTSLAEAYPGGLLPSSKHRSVACDALMASAPGEVTWPVTSALLSDAVAVESDARVAAAMRLAFDQFRLVLEPSGALALAAVLDGLAGPGAQPGGPVLPPGRVVGVVACGGNTDWNTYAALLGRPPPAAAQ